MRSVCCTRAWLKRVMVWRLWEKLFLDRLSHLNRCYDFIASRTGSIPLGPISLWLMSSLVIRVFCTRNTMSSENESSMPLFLNMRVCNALISWIDSTKSLKAIRVNYRPRKSQRSKCSTMWNLFLTSKVVIAYFLRVCFLSVCATLCGSFKEA